MNASDAVTIGGQGRRRFIERASRHQRSLASTQQCLSLTIGAGTGPTGGISGSVSLPGSWGSKIGLAPDAVINLSAAFGGPGGVSSCFKFSLASASGTGNVIDLGNVGVLTAKSASIYLAPTRCRAGSSYLSAGLSLQFDGAVFGVPVGVKATVKPFPFAIDASISLGNISLPAGFKVTDAALRVRLSAEVQEISFRAKAELLGATASVAGSFSPSWSGAPDLRFVGTFNLSLGGYVVAMTANFHSGGGRGGPGGQPFIAASGSSVIDILGYRQTVAFGFAFTNGSISELDAAYSASVRLGTFALNGYAQVQLVKGQFPIINLSGTATAGGRSFGSVNVVVGASASTINATIALPGRSPVITGIIAYTSSLSPGAPTAKIVNRAGLVVDANPGDFRFDASNIGLYVAGFDLNTRLSIGYVRGFGWAYLATSVRLGVDATNAEAQLYGSFGTDGTFDLVGTGKLSLVGQPVVDAKFHLKRTTTETSVRVSGKVNARIATLQVDGSFVHYTSGGTYFDLSGEVNLAVSGFTFGSGRLAVYRRPTSTPGGAVQGVEARGTLDIPGLTAVYVYMQVSDTGNVQFTARPR